MSRTTAVPAAHEVVAWYAPAAWLAANGDRRARAMQLLLPPERSRYERYRADDDRLMFLLGRVMARTMVGRALGVPASGWEWVEGEHGRPRIADPSCRIRFNVAHSGGMVVCAVACGREVGVDVEDLERRAPAPLVVRRYCSPAEAADIESHGDAGWATRFLSYWTLKEAYLKARGLGISVPLADVEFTLDDARPPRIRFVRSLQDADDRWAFHLTALSRRHLMAIAAPAPDGAPAFLVAPMPEDLL